MAECKAPCEDENKTLDKQTTDAALGPEAQLIDELKPLKLSDEPDHGDGCKSVDSRGKQESNTDVHDLKERGEPQQEDGLDDGEKGRNSLEPDTKKEEDNSSCEKTEISECAESNSSESDDVWVDSSSTHFLSAELKGGIRLSDEQRRQIEMIRESLNPQPLNAAGEVITIDDLLTLQKDGALLRTRSHLRSCAMLTVLNLNGCTELTETGVGLVCTHMPQLKELNLSKCAGVHDPSIYNISRCLKRLEKLSIDNCAQITNDGLEYIASIKKLRSLQMRWCYKINRIKCLSRAVNLQALALSGTLIRWEYRLRPLMLLHNLVVLELYDVPAATRRIVKLFSRRMPHCIVTGGRSI